jgi:uncharacterized RDD family membrane protein YckC
MSGWAPEAPAMDPSVKIPEGMQVAGMGRRIGAWILDFIFTGLISIFFGVISFVSGAVSFNRGFIDQYDENAADPFGQVTAPMLDINVGPLLGVMAFYVLLMAVYFIWPWITWGASPAQKMLGLKVADVSTGGNLSIDQAALRWAVLTGVTTVIGMGGLYMMLDWIAKTPTHEWLSYNQYGSASTSFSPGGGYTLVSTVSSLWPIVLVVVTGIDRMKRGWHDKVAGSVVLSQIQYAAYPAYGYPPGAPAWPPQAPGTTPGAPVWPPQAPGYPPSAYPGYPGYPGYPPQAAPGQPPMPDQPPAPPAPPADVSSDKPAGS